MRRIAKPFTVEVKKRGLRRRDGAPDKPDFPDLPETASVGRDWRFRDADNLFRNGLEPPAAEPHAPQPLPIAFDHPAERMEEPAPPRRILPDLIAEAAMSEQAVHPPEPRPRGRPRKNPDDRATAGPAKRGRPRKAAVAEAPLAFLERWDVPDADVTPAPAPPFDLGASLRRRQSRDTSHLPRAERWKRRLPRVCW